MEEGEEEATMEMLGLQPLEKAGSPALGGLVRVADLGGRRVEAWRTLAQAEYGEHPELVDASGHVGRYVSLSEGDEPLVATFEGVVVKVPGESLSGFRPLPPVAGGFDVAWPATDRYEPEFIRLAADALRTKGYCVVQLSLAAGVREEAARSAAGLDDHAGTREETEVDYWGRSNGTRVKTLEDDDPARAPDTALEACDRLLTTAGTWLESSALGAFDFELIGRTNGFARIPYASDDERLDSLPPSLSGDDFDEGRADSFLKFLRSRKVCAILQLTGTGSEIILHPRPGGDDDVQLKLPENRLLLFRHDAASYTYLPGDGDSTALQSWMMGNAPSVELSQLHGEQKDYAELLGLTGPWQPDGQQGAFIKSLMVRMPGRSWGFYAYWCMFTSGTDCVLEWDGTRWDTELYYEPDRDKAMMSGRSYMHHGGFLSAFEFNTFDNAHFRVSMEEAASMYPGQRLVLEVGYEALWRSGWSADSLDGRKISVCLGDVGPDWHSVTSVWPHMRLDTSIGWAPGEYNARVLGAEASLTCTRLSYTFGLKGPTQSLATACSSSLVALNVMHHSMVNAREHTSRERKAVFEEGLVVGINTLMGPFSFMGQCISGGTSYKGRCFTFDVGADGYQRGEGCSATYIELKSIHATSTDRMACVIGSSVNQDGRSASLTAPNGPSQSQMIKDSMKMGGLKPSEVTAAECHGTGTALGDPIEVGALMSVLNQRDRAILKTSAKSNMAHLEASAGMAGFAKCVMMIMNSATPPNQHLKTLNPHLHVEGYPVYFTSELSSWKQNSGYCGVSSFGIGGTNARGEVLGRCQRGPWSTAGELKDVDAVARKAAFVTVPCPRCGGSMGWLDGAALPSCSVSSETARPDLLLRDEWGDYSYCSRCYAAEGRKFRFGKPLEDAGDPGLGLFIRGTWDAFTKLWEMEETSPGTYVSHVALGDTRCERFNILAGESPGLVLYPVRDMGDPVASIQGPDARGLDKHWLIDGRDEQVPAGTVYTVTFRWKGDEKSILWEPAAQAEEEREEEEVHKEKNIIKADYKHRYYICGTWTAFKPIDMKRSEEDASLHEFAFKFGSYGRERFYFLRDLDESQVIYPVTQGKQVVSGKTTAPQVPAKGPDGESRGRNWHIRGREHDVTVIQLRLSDAHVVVTVRRGDFAPAAWHSVEGWARHWYYITGSFNNGAMERMRHDPNNPGTYVHLLALPVHGNAGGTQGAELQLVVDADPARRMYPQVGGAGSGEGFQEGPDAFDKGRSWLVCGAPGRIFEVTLDMRTSDRRRRVTWKEVRCSVLEDSE